MRGQRLDIIGNGFDRHHEIPSDYNDFAQHLKETDHRIFALVEEYFPVDENFWWEFETRLADFDADTVMDHAEQFLMPYGAEDWSDSGHHEYEYEIDQVVTALSEKMRHHFSDWVRALPMPDPASVVMPLHMDPSATFLNFNYTPTLQHLYGVPRANILHIHGCATDPEAKLILGHGWQRTPKEHFSGKVDEDTDTRVAGGYDLIDSYFERTFKPTAKVIHDNQNFFRGLSGVKDVRVMGHSLASVDEPYFREIMKHLDLTETRWRISYRDNPNTAREKFESFGITSDLVTYASLATF